MVTKKSQSSSEKPKTKAWLQELLDSGLHPYVSTSKHIVDRFDYSLLGGPDNDNDNIRLLENDSDLNFHNAYLLSNSLAFGRPDLKMPKWTLIDCVLLQTAVVGFAIKKEDAPESLLEYYDKDDSIDFDQLDMIPVSGQIAGLAADGKTFVGFSLFSLRRLFEGPSFPRLGVPTKALALYVYKGKKFDRFLGITQYDNSALQSHALFGEKMYIEQVVVPLHPLREMTLIYSMKVKLDDKVIANQKSAIQERPYDFLLRCDDYEKKKEMMERMEEGYRYVIEPPAHIIKNDTIHLPITEEPPCQEES